MFKFEIKKSLETGLGRAGIIKTPHGEIQTPAFIAVGTKATVKGLTVESLKEAGVQAVLGNTYHLFLEPGEKIVEKAGGLGKFMNWNGPTFTDSGGFQVFSLGAGFGGGISKFATKEEVASYTQEAAIYDDYKAREQGKLVKIDNEGVTFTSHKDGSLHRFTPERSVEIQHALGADIFFAFDECTSPLAPYEYQKEAMERTHAWAKRSLSAHRQNVKAGERQAIFGIVQGGAFEDLRKESARFIGDLDFDGYGIGGSYTKEEVADVLRWSNEILPVEKPKHLLGIGEPLDFFVGVEGGCDTFDCVVPTRHGRTGTVYTEKGRISLTNKEFREDFSPIDATCSCYVCKNYTKSYLAHLFHSKEMLGAVLGSIHNMHFLVHLVERIRLSILDDSYFGFKESFMQKYKQKM